MATAIAALQSAGKYIARGIYQMEWTAAVSGVGTPLDAFQYPDKTVQIQGPTSGGSSRIIIEGTNGGVVSTATWITLTTPTDGDLDFTNVTGGVMRAIRENPRMIRPRFESVTAARSLNVRIIAK